MKIKNQVVKPDDVRPARPDGTCFYCRASLGEEHKSDCVLREKTVVVDVTMRLVRRVPEHWDVSNIEYELNESSWCADNIVSEIKSVITEERCLCDRFSAKFIREATEEDEGRYGVCC